MCIGHNKNMNKNPRISEPTDGQIECIARAIIIDGDKLLLCRPIDKNYYFLPGGHVEFGESAETCLRREIDEELGVAAKDVRVVGFVDNIYEDERFVNVRHEINLLFEANLTDNAIHPEEKHIEIKWVDARGPEAAAILPLKIRDAVKHWTDNR